MGRIETEVKLDFKDVLIRPKRSELITRSSVTVEREYTFRCGRKWSGVPIMAANMDTTGTFPMARALGSHKMITVIHKHYSLDQWNVFLSESSPELLNYISLSCGTKDDDIDNVKNIFAHAKAAHIPFICVDVANGYSAGFMRCVKKVREEFPDKILIAGNVVTNEMTEELIVNGVDIVKVGIGSGSVCTTRKLTGCGYPQLSATIECADAAHGLKGHVICDGGITNAGDVAKAFGAGADFCMLGGMLAGHDESGGEKCMGEDGNEYKVFYGMSSDTAMNKYAGGVASYRASEGKTVTIPYRGSVHGTALDLMGGVRSACTYVGAACLRELSKRTTFIRVTQQLNSVYSGSEVKIVQRDIATEILN